MALVGGIPTQLKNMSSSVGMMIPYTWKVIKAMFQTTNQGQYSSNSWIPRLDGSIIIIQLSISGGRSIGHRQTRKMTQLHQHRPSPALTSDTYMSLHKHEGYTSIYGQYIEKKTRFATMAGSMILFPASSSFPNYLLVIKVIYIYTCNIIGLQISSPFLRIRFWFQTIIF